jgi:hypothetical protein
MLACSSGMDAPAKECHGDRPEELKTTLITAISSGKPVRVDMGRATDLDVTAVQLLWSAAREARKASPSCVAEDIQDAVRAERGPPTRGENGGKGTGPSATSVTSNCYLCFSVSYDLSIAKEFLWRLNVPLG